MIDAHNHLHDARLLPSRADWLEALASLPIEHAVVNGTRESDWDAVTQFAADHPWALPSYGLHPWYVSERSPDWLAVLERILVSNPHAAVGEVGLDRWIEGHDLADQSTVLRAQLAVATRHRRPVTMHCLRAWGPLAEILRSEPLPGCGFLIHAYGGPWEMTREFLDLGAFFSFNAYFLHERKAAAREVFARLPADRVLVETDAPDMPPPPERNAHPLTAPDGRVINHPANLALAYAALAELRQTTVEELTGQVRENFTRLFRPQSR